MNNQGSRFNEHQPQRFRPQQVQCRVLEGYALEKNRRTVREELFPSFREAMQFAGGLASYPIQWLEKGRVPEGFPFFKGAHARLISYWDKTPFYLKSKEETAIDDADLAALREELGDAAAWDYYYVDPIMTKIMEPIPGAEYIDDHQHDGFYIVKVRNDYWDICRETDSIYGPHADWAPSRVTALAKAWRLPEADLARQAKIIQRSSKAPDILRRFDNWLLKLLGGRH